MFNLRLTFQNAFAVISDINIETDNLCLQPFCGGIVVYKIDRLTRSLTDFAKLVDVFDEYGVSFVSVTQSFNTTTSMGRLTLNVLLSFAQFEREVIGERVRDKIAASKKKGMWMGGTCPVGYDNIDRQLVPKTEEVAFVRIHTMHLGLKVRILSALAKNSIL